MSMMKQEFVLALICLSTLAQGLSGPAPPCDPSSCSPPDCRCSSTDVPGGFESTNVPQIVVISFNEAMNFRSGEKLAEIFDGRFVGQNGCNFRATHFISHQYTDYSLVHNWWKMGHEIGSISIRHIGNTTYWGILNSTGWALEMDGMRKILNKFGNIPLDDIKGIRSPGLQNGGDLQMVMMQNEHFTYDSSMPSVAFGSANLGTGLWPYTFDYESIQDCEIPPCVYSSFPGIWEFPILTLEDDDGYPCSYLGDSFRAFDSYEPELVFNFLVKNFERAYSGNRAPFGLHTQVADFLDGKEWFYEGFLAFMEYLTTMPDVYVVTMQEALQYAKNPVPLSEIDTFTPFQCGHIPKPDGCTKTKSCRFTSDQLPSELLGFERYMTICGNTCPPLYPWIDNPFGEL